MQSDDNAILLHDIRAAMLNHSGLHREVQDSLTQLTDALQSLVSSSGAGEGAEDRVASLREEVNEILVEDIDQCMPMLQFSSDRLSSLLSTMTCEVIHSEADVSVGNRGN